MTPDELIKRARDGEIVGSGRKQIEALLIEVDWLRSQLAKIQKIVEYGNYDDSEKRLNLPRKMHAEFRGGVLYLRDADEATEPRIENK